jgi:long-chain acyl-CoA synthetase
MGSSATRPWLRFYGSVPPSLDYPEVTLYAAVARTAARVPEAIAWDFLDTTSSYRDFLTAIDRCAGALAALGLERDGRLLISMPTCPQAIIAFYAASRLGAVPAMIHPLSARPEIEHYLDASGARIALTLDAFYGVFVSLQPKAPLDTLILARIGDYLSPLKQVGYWLARGRKIPRVPADPRVRWWADLMAESYVEPPIVERSADDPAAILFSGGTTGAPKGIVLSSRNLIAEGMQAACWGGLRQGRSILAILPIFHGFGLGVCVNAAFMTGGKSILVPTFDARLVAALLKSKRPNLLVGVPTLYDALARDPTLARADLSCLHAAFSGADTLPRPLKERFEALVADRGGRVKLLEGYGLTEAVTAIMAMPLEEYREGSIGIPFPDMLAKICKVGTIEEAAPGEEGEICVAGPAVMLGYLDDPATTAEALRKHADGRVWLHTGDLGRMDADGFFYFTVRLKRMIKSSGFNVYPAEVEAVLYHHPLVKEACVVGVPDPSQGERVKAYVVLKNATQASTVTERALIEHCRQNLIKWSCPREVTFRRDLPRTRIGKIDYRALVQEDIAERKANEAP